MKKYSFFAMLSRMKYISRWGLMRNSRQENLSEHTLDVAYISHALALLSGIEPSRAVLCALYHDCAEIFTGDLPTPVKYADPPLRERYRELERSAAQRLISSLPDNMQPAYSACFMERDPEILRIVKAADKLSALAKCIEELKMGNGDFKSAKESQLRALRELDLPAANEFMEKFLPAYELTLDEIEK